MDTFFVRNEQLIKQMSEDSAVSDLFSAVGPGTKLETAATYYDYMLKLQRTYESDPDSALCLWAGDYDSSQYVMSDGTTSGLNNWVISERPWFAQAVSNPDKVIVSDPYQSSTGDYCLSFVKAVKDKSGNILGFVASDVTTDFAVQSAASHPAGQTGFYSVVTSSGTIVYSGNDELTGKLAAETVLAAGAAATDPGSVLEFEYDADGVTMMAAATAMKTSGWTVITAIPQKEFLADYNTTLSAFLLADAFLLIVLAVLLWFVAKRITVPIKQLADTAKSIASGEFDVEVNVASMDETGQLSMEIRQMVGQLRGYSDYINEITNTLNELANGNLRFELKHDYVGEFAKIKDALNNLSAKLTTTMRGIDEASDLVSDGALQLANASQTLSQGATEQASAIEELSATIESISSQVSDTADNSDTVSSATTNVLDELVASNEKMAKLMQAMGDIAKSSEEISRIIKAIEDIAFQTNILALNAAVEAARAGEAGKGFAVVADEVRNLASKSAEAAKDTTVLIQTSVEAVQVGTKLADEAAKSMLTVVDGAKNVKDTTSTISQATKEESSAIAQVVTGVEQISTVIQTNSATAEESAASSEELSSQAQILKNLVRQFKM